MRKIVILLLLAFAACNSPQDEGEIRDQISQYKKEIQELEGKIADLERKIQENHAGDDIYRVPVKIKTLQPEAFNHYFEVSGTVEAVNEAFISTEISGIIEEISVKEGERVNKGQVLVKLTTEVTENTIEEVQSSLDFAEVVYEKQKRLWEKGIGSEIQYLEAKNNRDALENKLETLKAQKRMAIITAPISGVVDELFRKEGELALPGGQLMQLVNLDELYINADVSESYLATLSEKENVVINFPVYPDLTLEEPVFRLGNVINPGNRTFKMQLKLKNPGKMLKPNILAIIKINDFSTDAAMVVPSNIIKQDKQGQYIYRVVDSENISVAEKVYIEMGMSYGSSTLISEGLAPGDRIITEGYNQVTGGSPVEIRN